MTQWIVVLRMAALLSLGWVLAAGFAWELFGVIPAALVLVAWVLLLVRFHKAMETLARSIAARGEPPAGA